ncbi:MCE family protein [Gordonia sp. ABSL1-1]|uniref:MCE family protein n=1 Tax=Gordonia sp. ABSL1-1 TaxID=3053923 RepID=UPI0025739F22|nr:MCE family protein [Gordonia sp. ABSL1-1]MDL9936218.1 MCE family protein [Gordonia sp. ABSL1-1]
MYKYRGSGLVRFGCVGLTLIVMVILVGLNAAKFSGWMTSNTFQADFEEAAGLHAGAVVMVSGVRVGTVSKVELVDGNARVSFSVDSDTRLGDTTTVQIRTGSLLGQRVVTVVPSGPGMLGADDVIPVTRTSSPYSLNEAVNDLTTNTKGIDTQSLNNSLKILTTTFNDVAPDLKPTFAGLADIARGLNERDSSLRELLGATGDVSALIAARAGKINALILNANLLFDVLVQRRQAISSLLVNTSVVAKELTKVVADNEKQLGPALDALNAVAAMLERNKKNISETLPGLTKASQTQGEAVSSGPFYQAYVANLIPGPLLQPFIDQAFGIEPKSHIPLPGAP